MGKGGLSFGWKQYGEILEGEEGSFFGTGISVLENGEKMIVGAPNENDGVGEVNFFTKGSWVFQAKATLILPDDNDNDLGFSVKLFNTSKFKLISEPSWNEDDNNDNKPKGRVLYIDLVYDPTNPNANNGFVFTKVQEIQGDNFGDYLGGILALSGDENTFIASIGRVVDGEYFKGLQVYVRNTEQNEWQKKGDPIQVVQKTNLISFDVNEDGSRIVVGNPIEGGNGTVITYEWDNEKNTWNNIYKLSNAESVLFFGISLSISKSGNFMVVGVPGSELDKPNLNKGRVLTYRWEENEWKLMNNILYGDKDLDFFGLSVKLSPDDSTLAVAKLPGKPVYLYTWTGSKWESKGNPIENVTTSFPFNEDTLPPYIPIEMTKEGNLIVISDIFYNNYTGRVSSFEWVKTN